MKTDRANAVNRLASFVVSVLPDSLRARREVLADLLVIMGSEHPLHGEVATRLADLSRDEDGQLWLSNQFRALSAIKS